MSDTMLSADAIPWTLPAIARLEDVDVLSLSPTELLAHAADLAAETAALRLALHEAIHALARAQDEAARHTRTIEWQREQLRAQQVQLNRLTAWLLAASA